MTSETQVATLFEERQKFTQPWMWALILLPVAIILPLAALAPRPRGGEGMAAIGIVVLVMALTVGIFAVARMTTAVTPAEVHLRYTPFFVDKHIAMAEIARFRPLEYSFWRTGYGIHYSRYGWVYNVSGGEGVQLELRDGKKLLLGTQRLREFTAALEQAGARLA